MKGYLIDAEGSKLGLIISALLQGPSMNRGNLNNMALVLVPLLLLAVLYHRAEKTPQK